MKTLHATVEGYTQRTGRNIIRKDLLQAIVDRTQGLGWSIGPDSAYQYSLNDGRKVPTLDPGTDPQLQESYRFLSPLIFKAIRRLSGLPVEDRADVDGAFLFEFEKQVITVRVTFGYVADTERVELRFDSTDAQQIIARQMLSSGAMNVGNTPDEDAEWPTALSAVKWRHWVLWSAVTLISIGLALGTAQVFYWPVTLLTFLWGLLVVPSIGYWFLNRLSALSASDDNETTTADKASALREQSDPRESDSKEIRSSIRDRWSVLGLILVFFVTLWLPGLAATIYERSWLKMDLFFTCWSGFLTSLWLLLLFSKRDLPVEPL